MRKFINTYYSIVFTSLLMYATIITLFVITDINIYVLLGMHGVLLICSVFLMATLITFYRSTDLCNNIDLLKKKQLEIEREKYKLAQLTKEMGIVHKKLIEKELELSKS